MASNKIGTAQNKVLPIYNKKESVPINGLGRKCNISAPILSNLLRFNAIGFG
jgi:hypothetical protein